MSNTVRHIALLRGINVGGHKKIKMAELRVMLTDLGFSNVATVLATGNIGFDADEMNASDLQTIIHDGILDTFGHDVDVLMRTQANIQALVATEPFASVAVTENTRLNVSFLGNEAQNTVTLPYDSPAPDFDILHVSATEVCSVWTLNGKVRSTDYMKILEQEFGKNITTRNWNTVLKIADL